MSAKKSKLVVTRYRIPFKDGISCRIALVSDLHERPADKVLGLLRREQPDLIIAAGDILERCTEGVSWHTKDEMDAWQGITKDRKAYFHLLKGIQLIGRYLHEKDKTFNNGISFLKHAAKIAPVFYGLGNHEWYFLQSDEQVFAKYGINVLDNRDIAWNIQEQSPVLCDGHIIGSKNIVRIGGLSTRYDLKWLEEFSRKDGCKILICHHPEYYRKYIRGTKQDTFALILSGHVHGGQWRVGKRGILAPGQGLFPEYCHGLYHEKLVVSSGLANTANIPRFGNPTELVIIQVDGKYKNNKR